ncbi:hypothetical protein JXQ70_06675 [bacterium]|nr:hypothetical protein [bacterium]
MTGFGSETYSKEELVAELGSAYLCALTGIEAGTFDNSAAYVAGWLQKLSNDRSLIISAASAAQKSVDYILNIQPKKNDAPLVTENPDESMVHVGT